MITNNIPINANFARIAPTANDEELHRLLDTAHRLEAMRTAAPRPLPRRHDRDELARHPGSITAPTRDHKPRGPQPPHSWNWKSKGT